MWQYSSTCSNTPLPDAGSSVCLINPSIGSRRKRPAWNKRCTWPPHRGAPRSNRDGIDIKKAAQSKSAALPGVCNRYYILALTLLFMIWEIYEIL